MRRIHTRSSGQFIVEILVSIGLMLVVLPTLVYLFIAAREGKPQQDRRDEAQALLTETYEAVRSIHANGWENVAITGTFYPHISGSSWTLSSGSETVGAFTRSIGIADVYRNSEGAIVEASSGQLDPSTRKVTATVSWTQPRASSLHASWYLGRYLANTSVRDTTVSDFTQGVRSSTQVTDTDGGEITLANNNRAKWCTPALSSVSIDLPDGPPVAVVATASASVTNPNDVFVATAPTVGSSIKMAYVTVSADTDVPQATLRGMFTMDPAQYSSGGLVPSGTGLDNAFKTNDIKYYRSASGNVYALMTTDLAEKEVIAVQVKRNGSDAYQDPVNKIYTYWSYFNTKIYDAAYHAPTAQAAETVSSGDNNGFQTSPTNGYQTDGQFAVDTNSGSNTGTSCTGTDKDKHRYYNYNFSLPSGATINGIEAKLVAKVDSTTGSPVMCVQVSSDGGATWTAAKTTAALSTTSTTYTLGGASDTWGRSWTDTDFSNANFRLRIIDVSSNTSRDFSLDSVGVKVYYNGISTMPNDQNPFGYGGKALTILGDRGYVTSGGYLYVFDLRTIDTKSPTSPLDQVGCRIQLDGYDCSPGTGTDKKYAAGETGGSWSDTTSPAHVDCSDGGNVELYADNDIHGVVSGGHNYIYVAVGAGTNPEFEIVDATTVPDQSSSPSIGNSSCGRISGGNSGWKMVGSLDFNSTSGTEEAANSVFAKSDGSRAYISSNGGIDANHDGKPDSDQLYIIDTSTKTSPKFLSGTSSTGALSGYYYGTGANAELYPRRSLTVLNGLRAVLVGKDGVTNTNDAQEYQVLNIDSESTPTYCGGISFDAGFNDLTSVSEADGDNFVYMVANTPDKQLKIIEGGPDTGLYLTPGTFESRVFSTASAAAFNRVHATVSLPPQTSVKLQVAVAPQVSGSCTAATYAYVGPTGDNTSYFTPVDSVIDGVMPIGLFGQYQNPNQCYRYKLYLETADTNQTPVVSSVSTNYSP